MTEAFEVTGGASISGNITSTGGNLVATSGYVQTGGAYFSGNLRVLNNAGDGWNTFATRTDGIFHISNVVLKGGTSGARLEANQWIYDNTNLARFYFEGNGRTFYRSNTGHQFRNSSDTTDFNISNDGHIHIASNGDSQASSTEYIKAGGTAILTSSRVLQNVSGNISMFTNDSGYLTSSSTQTKYLRSDTSDTYTSGTLTFGSGTGFDLASNDVYAAMRVIRNNGGITDGMYIGYANSGTGTTRIFGGGATSGGLRVNGSGVNDVKIDGNTVWHAGNDGSGSGLDAHTLEGKTHTAFGATLATYGTTGAAGARIRCTAPFATNSAHMFQITISLIRLIR